MEAAILIPVFVFVFVSVLYHLIYFYDKALCLGAATETAAVACEMKRYDVTDEREIMAYFHDKIEGKPVYFTNYIGKLFCGDGENICIRVNAKKRGLSIDVEGRMPDTSPEMALRYKKDMEKKKEEMADEGCVPEGTDGEDDASSLDGNQGEGLPDKNDGAE